MSAGHPEYGCFISSEKTVTNFYSEMHSPKVLPQTADFPWCGLLINCASLGISVDYSRYGSHHIADTLTVAKGRRAGSEFQLRMLRMCRQAIHPIFTDIKFNSLRTVQLNIFKSFCLTAAKMHHYLKQWGCDVSRHHTFILYTITRSIRVSWNTHRARLGSHVGSSTSAKCGVGQSTWTWLALSAFRLILGRKQSTWTSMLAVMDSLLQAPKYADVRSALGSVVRVGTMNVKLNRGNPTA